MSAKSKSDSRVVIFSFLALAAAIGLSNPLLLLAVSAVMCGVVLVLGAVMKRRPMKPAEINSIYLFPGEFHFRVAEAISPGLGTLYARIVCLWCALMCFAGAAYLFGRLLGKW